MYTQGEVKHDPEVDQLGVHETPRDCGRVDAVLAGCELAAHIFAATRRSRLASYVPAGACGGRQASHLTGDI